MRLIGQEMDHILPGFVYIWHPFRSHLGREVTEPFINHCELRLDDMFSACTVLF